MSILDTIKAHPYWVGAGVFVVGAVFLYSRSGSSGGTSSGVINNAVSPAAIQGQVQLAGINAATQTQLAGIDAATQTHLADTSATAQTQRDQTAAELQALTLKYANDFQIARLGADVQSSSLVTQENIASLNAATQTHDTDTQLQAVLAQFATTSHNADVAAATQLAAIEASVGQNEFIAAQQNQLQMAIANNQFAIGSAQIAAGYNTSALNVKLQDDIVAQNAETVREQQANAFALAGGQQALTYNLASLSAGITSQQIGAQMNIADLTAQLQRAGIDANVSIANLNAGTQRDIAQLTTNAGIRIADINAGVMSHQIDASAQSHYYDDLLSYFNTKTISDASVSIAKTNASASNTNSLIGGITSIGGKILGGLF